MPMADVTSKVCDLCEGMGARPVTIKEERRNEFTVDLCPQHYEQITAYRDVGRTARGGRAYRRYVKQLFVDR